MIGMHYEFFVKEIRAEGLYGPDNRKVFSLRG